MNGVHSMSEVSGVDREGVPQVSRSESELSAGAVLRQAREAAGMSLEVLAASHKVTVDKLAALESDRWEALPDVVFARGLAASVCRSLSVDPAPVLQRLPQAGPRLVPQGEHINAPFKAERAGAGGGLKAYLTRPVGLAVLALLAAAAALLLWPATATRDSVPPRVQVSAAVAEVPAPASTASGVSPAMGAEATPQLVPAVSAPVEPGPAAVATASSPAGPVPVVPVAAGTSPVAGDVAPTLAPAEASPPVTPESLLGFNASADSWVKVTDARGVVVLSRLVRAGESVNATGTVPLAVVVGRADATRVTVRGKAMDLVPIARDNVARFEVK